MFQNQVDTHVFARNEYLSLLFSSFDRWYSGFVGWSSLVRLRHVTSGLYLAVIGDENGKERERERTKLIEGFCF